MAAALRMLGRRDHSCAELAAKLAAKGHGPDEVARVLSRLQELKYLDDRRLADRLAAVLSASGRGVGRRLVLELRRRGIPPELAAAVAAASSEASDDLAVARELLARRYPTFGPAADLRERRRVMHFLQRRGFAMDTIWQVVNFTDIEETE